MISVPRYRVGLLLLPALVGCPSADEPAAELPIAHDTYVDVMVELTRLKRLPPPARGEPERERLSDSIRAEILARHGVTAAEVVAFADVAGRDPTLMMGLSQAIAERADSLQVALARGDSVTATDSRAGADSARPIGTASKAAGAAEEAAGATTDSVPGPRFAAPVDSVASDRPADTPRLSPRRSPRRAIERPVKARDPD